MTDANKIIADKIFADKTMKPLAILLEGETSLWKQMKQKMKNLICCYNFQRNQELILLIEETSLWKQMEQKVKNIFRCYDFQRKQELKKFIFGYSTKRNIQQNDIGCKSVFEKILSASGSSKLCLNENEEDDKNKVYANLYSLIWKKYDLCRREEVLRMVS